MKAFTMLNAKKPINRIYTCYDLLCVCASERAHEREREREREKGGEEKPGINENWCEDSGRMYKVKIRNHKYMNPVGTT